MEKFTLGQVAQWCNGRIDPEYAGLPFVGIRHDSRNILPGYLFIAIQGNVDGHAYIPAALKNGAAAVVCSRYDGGYPAIVVEDTRIALGQIARGLRMAIGMQVVAVTGSVGKSTTKEMIACVLAKKYRVAKTPANHNNDLGMPLAVLSMPEDTQVAVLEMGMNHAREIAYLSRIGQPDLAVITNIGSMHIEHLGSQEGILRAKLEITEGMKQNGRLFLYGDDPFLQKVPQSVSNPITYFGTGENSQLLARDIREEAGGISFRVSCPEEDFVVHLPVEGLHFVPDALAAIAVGLAMGVSSGQIAAALADFQNMEGRQEIFEAKGYTVIKDCYNAGPESMAAALAVLGKRSGRRVAVLGEMLELGELAPDAHYRLGQTAARQADMIFALGPNAGQVVRGAQEAGMSNVWALDQRDALVSALKERTHSGDTLLIKGSRGMQMELALEQLLEE